MEGAQMKEKTSWQRQDASTDEVIKNGPSTGYHTLHQRPVEEQGDPCHLEEEWDPLSPSSPGSSDNEKGPIPGVSPFGKGLRTRQIRMSSENKQHQGPF